MIGIVPRWVCYGLIGLATGIMTLSTPIASTLPITRLSEALIHQQHMWDKLDLQHHLLMNSCGSLFIHEHSLPQSRVVFERYQNESATFLNIVGERMPKALLSNNCSDFILSSRLAIAYSTSIPLLASTLIHTISDGLIPASRRKEVSDASAAATSQFTKRVGQLLRSTLLQSSNSVFKVWLPLIAREETKRAHNEVGVTMLELRSCVYRIDAVEIGVGPLSESFGQVIESYSDFVTEAITSSEAWNSLEMAEKSLCTRESLDGMRLHHQKIMSTALLSKMRP